MDKIKSLVERFEGLAKTKASQAAKSDESDQSGEYECAVCRDQGIVPVINGLDVSWDDVAFKDFSVRFCGCTERKRIQRLFKSSHITDEFQRLGFQNFVTDGRPKAVIDAKQAAIEYWRAFGQIRSTRHNSMALLGVPGSGKTHLLMAVSNNLMRKGVGVLYFPWVEGFGDLKDNLDDLEEKIGHMKRVDVLYIDDLYKGRRAPTDFQIEQLFAVVNYRYLNHLPILVSSEKTIDDMCVIDEGIGSRIYEMCKAYTVLMELTNEERDRGLKLNYRL